MDQIPSSGNREAVHQHDFSDQLKALVQDTSRSKKVQMQMIVVFMLVSLFTNLQYNTSNLLYMNPAFQCEGVEDKATEEYACQRIDSCRIINAETITAQLGLYCDGRTNDRILIQTSSGVGSWFGLIFATIISDRRGRKFSFVFALITMIIGAVFQFMGIRLGITIFLVCSEAICGFAGKAIYFNFLILSTRFLKKEVYETVSLLWLIASGCTEMGISIINAEFADWRVLFYLYLIGNIAASFFAIFILHEDPIYYFDSGKYDMCKHVFREITLQNNQSQAEIEEKMREIDGYIQAKKYSDFIHEREQHDFDYTQVLRCDILTNVFILGMLGCFYNMSGSSIDLSIQTLKLSYNQNLFIVGASKIVGYLLAIYIIQIEKERRRGFLLSAGICGAAGMMFAFKFCTENNIVETIVIIVLRIALCWNGNFYVRLKVDLFPEKYQATLIGVVEFLTNFGKTLCPLFTQLSIQHSLNPIFTINLLHITIGTLPIFLLNQSKIKIQRILNVKSLKAIEN